MGKKTKPNIWQMEDATDLEKINIEWPEHDRTSCSDADLYNAGTVFLRHRCERCEALSQLKYKELLVTPQPPQAERVPMTDEEARDMGQEWYLADESTTALIRRTEAFHDITEAKP